MVVVAVATIGLWIDDWRLRGRLENVTAEYVSLGERERGARQVSEIERARADRLSEALEQLQSRQQPGRAFPTSAGSVAALSLTPGFTRTNERLPELAIEDGISIALLELGVDIPEAVGSYRVVIETADGREVLRQDATRPSPAKPDVAVVIAIAASGFEAGDYIVRLQQQTPSQFENLHTYRFRVVKGAVQ